MRSRAEDILQKAAAAWLDKQGWRWCHPANERRTSTRAGGQLRAKGVKAGVPDILIFEPWFVLGVICCNGSGIAIELKSKAGRVDAEQQKWLTSLGHRGWRVAVCRSLKEVKEACEVLSPRSR